MSDEPWVDPIPALEERVRSTEAELSGLGVAIRAWQDSVDERLKATREGAPALAHLGGPTRNAAEAGPTAPWSPNSSTPDLNAALAAALPSILGAVKDARNPHLNTSYADLASVMHALKDPLAAQGLAISQEVGSGEFFQMLVETADRAGGKVESHLWASNVVCVTRLLHSSGQERVSVLRGTAVQAKGLTLIQAVGSLLTHLRRYGASAIVGLPQVDDDGGRSEEPKKESAGVLKPKGTGR